MQIVVDRMFKRMVTFAGVPMLTGFALFPLFWYLRVSQLINNTAITPVGCGSAYEYED